MFGLSRASAQLKEWRNAARNVKLISQPLVEMAGKYYGDVHGGHVFYTRSTSNSGINLLMVRDGSKYHVVRFKRNKTLMPSLVGTLRENGYPVLKDLVKAVIQLSKGNGMDSLSVKGIYYPSWVEDCLKDFFFFMEPKAFMDLILTKEALAQSLFKEWFPELGEVSSEVTTKVDGFEVVSTEGSKFDMKEVEKILDEVSKIMKANGYGEYCYGELQVLPAVRGARTLATYEPQSNSVRLTAKAGKMGGGYVQSMIHELGHRVWYKGKVDKTKVSMKYREILEKGRDTNIKVGDEYEGKKGEHWVVTGSRYVGRKIYWLIVNQDEKPKEMPQLPPGAVAGTMDQMLRDQMKNRKTEYRVLPEVLSRWKKLKGEATPERDIFDVSVYGRTSVEEFFAEVFAHGLEKGHKELTAWLKEVISA